MKRLNSDRGATFAEYALLAALIVFVCVYALQNLESAAGNRFASQACGLNTAVQSCR